MVGMAGVMVLLPKAPMVLLKAMDHRLNNLPAGDHLRQDGDRRLLDGDHPKPPRVDPSDF